MLADPTPEFGPMPTSIYLYVADCDAVDHRALSSCEVSVFPIMTLPSGERMAASKTPAATSGGCHTRGTALERVQNSTTRSECTG